MSTSPSPRFLGCVWILLHKYNTFATLMTVNTSMTCNRCWVRLCPKHWSYWMEKKLLKLHTSLRWWTSSLMLWTSTTTPMVCMQGSSFKCHIYQRRTTVSRWHSQKVKKILVEQMQKKMQWLEEDFLGFLDQWEKSVEERPGEFTKTQRNKMLLSAETRMGLRITCKIWSANKWYYNLYDYTSFQANHLLN